MASENFTPVEYEALKQALRIKMKSDPRFKDYDFEGSGLSAILKMLSSMGSSQNLNSHFVLGESHISTSDILGNVQALVTASNGYVPASQTSSRGVVTIEVTPTVGVTPPASLTLPLTFTAIGLQDGKSYRFTPSEEITAPLVSGKYVFENVIMVEGELVTNTFVQNGSALAYFTIPNKAVDINTIVVSVRESVAVATLEQFTRFHSAFQLGAAASLFYLSMDRNGYYRVNFGDSHFSKALDDGNIVYVTYKSSNGELSNGVTSLTAASEIGGFSDVTISLSGPTTGGAPQETKESIQQNSSLAYGMDGVAVATQEYGLKLKELYPAYRVTQWDGSDNIPPKPGFVILSTYPSLTQSEKNAGIEWLRKYSVGSILTQIVDSKVFEVRASLFYVSDFTDESKKVAQRNEIKSFCLNYSEQLKMFNASFEPNAFEEALKASVGSINRCYISYVMGAEGTPSKKSVSFDFHRQLDISTFTVNVDDNSSIDAISFSGGEMVGTKDGVVVATFSYTNSSGLLTLNGLESLEGSTFGVGYAQPAGEDMQVTSGRDELLDLIITV